MRYPYDDEATAQGKVIVGCFLICLALAFSFFACVMYVAFHFISKVW